MATKKATAVKTEGRVELYIPRTEGNNDPNVLISVNGKNWLIPKGKTVWVPPEAMAEYKRAQKAYEKYFRLVEERIQNQQA